MSAFPEPKFADINGIRMAYYEEGAEGALPVIFSHGFPELAYSWRHQLPAVAAAGFRAIAPDQRGYGLTNAPEKIEDYDITQLTGDLVALLDHLGEEKAIFVGHDWGGMVVWAVGQLHPSRVAGVVGVNTPFLPRAPMKPIDMMRAAFGESHYIVHFQQPGDADRRLAADTRRTLSQLYRKGVPLKQLMDEAKKTGKRPSFNLCEIVEGEDAPGEMCVSPEELDFYVKMFEKSGFTGGINWYRNMNRNWELMENVPQKMEAPSLMVTAKNDVALPPSLAKGMERYVPDLETYMIEDCGHWTQSEQPARLNEILTTWLTKRFG